jgi:hypothetical protein
MFGGYHEFFDWLVATTVAKAASAATAATATTTTTGTASAATAATLGFWASFINVNGSTFQILAVHFVYRLFGFILRRHLNKSETS